MKVILLQDVARLGHRFEVKDVPDGHALNMLIPRKIAEPATRENLKRLEERNRKSAADQAHTEEQLHETLAKLRDKALVLRAPANEQGHLFKGVKASDIAAHIAKEVGPMSEANISLKTPLKETGAYTIEVKVGKAEHPFTLTIEKE